MEITLNCNAAKVEINDRYRASTDEREAYTSTDIDIRTSKGERLIITLLADDQISITDNRKQKEAA